MTLRKKEMCIRDRTPCVEHIENLCSKQGGDNEKLIFKILKRGEKLKIDEAKEEIEMCIRDSF